MNPCVRMTWPASRSLSVVLVDSKSQVAERKSRVRARFERFDSSADRVHPSRPREGRLLEICGAEPRGHQLAQRHDANANTNADFANQAHAGDQLSELVQRIIEQSGTIESRSFASS